MLQHPAHSLLFKCLLAHSRLQDSSYSWLQESIAASSIFCMDYVIKSSGKISIFILAWICLGGFLADLSDLSIKSARALLYSEIVIFLQLGWKLTKVCIPGIFKWRKFPSVYWCVKARCCQLCHLANKRMRYRCWFTKLHQDFIMVSWDDKFPTSYTKRGELR